MYTYELQAQCWLGGGSAGWGSGGWLEMLFIPPTRFLFPVKLARTSGLTLARNTSFSRDRIVTVSSSFDILSRSSSTSDLTALIRWDFTKSIACSILLSMEPCPAPEALTNRKVELHNWFFCKPLWEVPICARKQGLVGVRHFNSGVSLVQWVHWTGYLTQRNQLVYRKWTLM